MKLKDLIKLLEPYKNYDVCIWDDATLGHIARINISNINQIQLETTSKNEAEYGDKIKILWDIDGDYDD